MGTILTPWREATLVALDLETTGKYPLEAEICEIAAVKWRAGKIVDEYQTLVKPKRPMNAAVIAIHNITNEMVASSPDVSAVLADFQKFIGDGTPIAHHAPFDMGFLAWDFELHNIAFPPANALCTAVISRKAIPASPNHRLQTLVHHLGLEERTAHRALDDARSCLDVALKCFERIGAHATLQDLLKYQEVELSWKRFSLNSLADKESVLNLISAIRGGHRVEMVYGSGSRPGQARELVPIGIVRNPKGDFLVAHDPNDDQSKRFFVEKIGAVKILR